MNKCLKILSSIVAILAIVIALLVGYDVSLAQVAPFSSEHDEILKLDDGRNLSFTQYGDLKGTPVLYLHGTPNNRFFFGNETLLRKYNIRIISPDRPGFGKSDYHPKLDLINYSSDIKQLLNYLKIDKTAIFAASGGVPFAYGLVKSMPDRITFVSIVSGGAPVNLAGGHSKWALNGMYKMYNIAPPLLSLMAYATRQGMTFVSSQQFQDMLEGSLKDMPSEDSKVFSEVKGIKKYLAETFLDSLRQGSRGLYREFELNFNDWGFKLEDLDKKIPISIWHGEKDNNVPIEYFKFVCKALPQAECKEIPGEGHAFIFMDEYQEKLYQLISQKTK